MTKWEDSIDGQCRAEPQSPGVGDVADLRCNCRTQLLRPPGNTKPGDHYPGDMRAWSQVPVIEAVAYHLVLRQAAFALFSNAVRSSAFWGTPLPPFLYYSGC
jgi:hypothetical protein